MDQLFLFDLAWISSGYSDLRWFCPVCFHEYHSVSGLLGSVCPYCHTDHLFYDPDSSSILPDYLRSCVFLSVSMPKSSVKDAVSKIPVLETDIVYSEKEN